jgi:hypothetical protein
MLAEAAPRAGPSWDCEVTADRVQAGMRPDRLGQSVGLWRGSFELVAQRFHHTHHGGAGLGMRMD